MQLCLPVCSYLLPSIKMATYDMQPCGLLLQFSANSVIASHEPTSIARPVQDLGLRKLRVSSICNESPVPY